MDPQVRAALNVVAPVMTTAVWSTPPGGVIAYIHPGAPTAIVEWMRAACADSDGQTEYAEEITMFAVRVPRQGIGIAIGPQGELPRVSVIITNLAHVEHLVRFPRLFIALPSAEADTYAAIEVDLRPYADLIATSLSTLMQLRRDILPRIPIPPRDASN